MPETRVAFALIPGEPHFSAVVKASAAITDSIDNRNIIDADRFPPHASLHICTIPTCRLPGLFTHLGATTPPGAHTARLDVDRLREGSSGYITLELAATSTVMALHEWAIQSAAVARGYGEAPGGGSVRDRYGSTWVRDKFTPHYSIAKVDPDDQRDAYEIASEALTGLGPASVARIEVCDIGPRSEKWDVLHRLDN